MFMLVQKTEKQEGAYAVYNKKKGKGFIFL